MNLTLYCCGMQLRFKECMCGSKAKRRGLPEIRQTPGKGQDCIFQQLDFFPYSIA
jgi:hypothetical protein